MIDFGDTITVNLGRAAIKDELIQCEYGSYEDHIVNVQCDRCVGSGERFNVACGRCDGSGKVVQRLEPYDRGRLHIVELLQRDKTKTRCKLHTAEEANEFFVQASTGTFGLYHLHTLRRIYKELAPFIDEKTKARVKYGSLGY